MTDLHIDHLRPQQGLFSLYPNESKPQSCFLALGLESGWLWADYNPEIGNAVPIDVWEGCVRRYYLPGPLHNDTANALLDELGPLAQRVLDGSEVVYANGNRRGRLNEDAEAAEQEIVLSVAEVEPDFYWVFADEWLDKATADEARAQFIDGESLEEVVRYYQGDGKAEDQPYIEGLEQWLENIATEEVQA